MYKVQFTAQVNNADTGEYTAGWIDKARPIELREEHTDVPEYEFETYEDAVEAIRRFIGDFVEDERAEYIMFTAEDSEVNYETDEDFTYGAMLEGDRD